MWQEHEPYKHIKLLYLLVNYLFKKRVLKNISLRNLNKMLNLYLFLVRTQNQWREVRILVYRQLMCPLTQWTNFKGFHTDIITFQILWRFFQIYLQFFFLWVCSLLLVVYMYLNKYQWYKPGNTSIPKLKSLLLPRQLKLYFNFIETVSPPISLLFSELNTDRNILDFHALILKCLCVGAISLNLKIQFEIDKETQSLITSHI
jgi:hypothetical protein